MLEQETEIKPRAKFLQKIKRITFSPNIFFGSVCCVLLLLILILHYPKQPKQPMFDYKVVSFLTNGNDRTGSGAVRYSTINISESDLMILGVQGWELVSTSLEMETAYPNFGDRSYVTGIQPNVRPQKLICIFKRRVI